MAWRHKGIRSYSRRPEKVIYEGTTADGRVHRFYGGPDTDQSEFDLLILHPRIPTDEPLMRIVPRGVECRDWPLAERVPAIRVREGGT